MVGGTFKQEGEAGEQSPSTHANAKASGGEPSPAGSPRRTHEASVQASLTKVKSLERRQDVDQDRSWQRDGRTPAKSAREQQRHSGAQVKTLFTQYEWFEAGEGTRRTNTTHSAYTCSSAAQGACASQPQQAARQHGRP